jgi:tRNA threonylcarbamoyladenosine biosynthesis protein TsaB
VSYKTPEMLLNFALIIMALILNIDTSSSVCSACLAEDGNVIEERNDLSENKHASGLTTLIEEIMDNQRIKLRDISAVALSSGPGSYTGLRIGTSVAKGLCYGLGKPLIAVSTLQGMAHSMSELHPDTNGIYIPMIDARRNDVYMAVYDPGNKVLEKDRFATVDVVFADTLSSYNVKNIYFGGSGASKLEIICLNTYFGTLIENIICMAANISAISYKRFVHNMFEDLTYFEPFYLKEFEGRMKIG